MTLEYFNTFANICVDNSWKITNQPGGDNVEFWEFEEIRKESYPYNSHNFEDYIHTVFEVLHNEDAKIIDNHLGVPIHPHQAVSVQEQRTAFLKLFQDIYSTICTQGYSPMSISEDEIESESEDDNEEQADTDHPLRITNTEHEGERVSDNNSFLVDGNVVGSFDQEHRHAYFEENYNEPIDVADFDEIRRLLVFDDELEMPEQE